MYVFKYNLVLDYTFFISQTFLMNKYLSNSKLRVGCRIAKIMNFQSVIIRFFGTCIILTSSQFFRNSRIVKYDSILNFDKYLY